MPTTSADRSQPPPLPRRPPAPPLNRVVGAGAALEGMARLTLSHSKDRYAFTKGAAVIVANTEWSSDRFSSLPVYQVDVERLSAVLPKVGFELYRRPQFNLTAEEMQSFMRDVGSALNNDGDAYDAVMVVLLSHGSQDVIYGTDGKAVPLDDLYACVNRPTCLALEKKPKIFIVQACRGHQREDADIRPASTSSVPLQADYLHAFASPRGYVSWVDRRDGSFYIRTLVECLETLDKSRVHFADILTIVNRKMQRFAQEGFLQVPSSTSQLSKKLFLYNAAADRRFMSFSEGADPPPALVDAARNDARGRTTAVSTASAPNILPTPPRLGAGILLEGLERVVLRSPEPLEEPAPPPAPLPATPPWL